MRRQVFGLTMAGALLLGSASRSEAQFSISVGNPYAGQGYTVSGGTTPYGYGVSSYSSGYSGYYGMPSAFVSTPGVTYSSGYAGVPSYGVPSVYNYGATSYYSPTSYYAPGAYVAPYATYAPVYGYGYGRGGYRRGWRGRGYYGY